MHFSLGSACIVSTPFRILNPFSEPSPKDISLYPRFLFVRAVLQSDITVVFSFQKDCTLNLKCRALPTELPSHFASF